MHLSLVANAKLLLNIWMGMVLARIVIILGTFSLLNLINNFFLSLTCSGGTENDCLTCDAAKHRPDAPVSSACPCLTGFFENTDDEECTGCHESWFINY